ncbi:uncharacterized protein NFIA_080490 [Aspergillus fischeri NRRL 181]|uniref:BTB domain-containing protein n=1 Tax=Neosartorya fischeri (strain ATCC 1020 / DSM 3700 / CBS 544.65 / FGSC A1164 / JCM 1740 / NRRL 181 / WB 181) TaxID=331117 RepID=A1DFE8_NEOFI|nr:conserved hypothetical protein [Aspergillus fischeri NRRL 181]EAW18105.1 conserved hypothetical protein [Aspergillus fischeri NRRL 181]KAG2016649.1 hypothetical protein GB937_006127 [Aspergillus fischeri]
MGQPTHIIDPEGEAIIVLSNPNAPFAELSEDMIPRESTHPLLDARDNIKSPADEIKMPEDDVEEPMEPLSKKKKMRKKNKKRRSSPCYDDPIPLEPPQQPIEEPVVEEAAPEWPTTGWTVAEEPAVEEPVVEEPAETGVAGRLDQNYFRIQVSAKHLILASSFFKKLLKGAWQESLTYLQKGSVEITADTWDLEALLILRVIHGQYYHVPRKITLETLAKVAVLANYYDCREALDILANIWINALEETIPKSYSQDLILWLWISWFFQLPAQFREATSTAMSCSNNRIDNLALPIPDNIISKDP